MTSALQKIENYIIEEDKELYNQDDFISNKVTIGLLLDVENFPQPPVNSLSELIFLNKIDELKERLEEKDANPNERDENGITVSWTPLYWSVKLGNKECVKILLKSGADINLVVNDSDECCGTVLDLVTLRDDVEMEVILRDFAEETNIGLGQAFKAIRTRLRGKAPACSFKYYGKKQE